MGHALMENRNGLAVAGKVSEANGTAERRTYYEPAVELKRLVGGFIREQVRPHLDSGRNKIKQLSETARDEGILDVSVFQRE